MTKRLGTIHVVLLLIASYFLGLIVKEVILLFAAKIIGEVIVPGSESLSYSSGSTAGPYLTFMEKVVNHYSQHTLREFERIIFFDHIGLSIGLSSLISALLMFGLLIKNYFDGTWKSLDVFPFVLLVLIAVLCLILHHFYLKQENNVLDHLKTDMIEKGVING